VSAARIEADVVVVGEGAAGVAAARAAHEAGASVVLVSEGPGATAQGGGAIWGSAAEPFGRWSGQGGFQRGGRYVTLGGWVIADVVGALDSLLDIGRVAPNAVLGVVDLPTHPCWSPRMLASALGAAVIPLSAVSETESFAATARLFDAEGVLDAVAEALRDAVAGRGVGALLFPPVLGLRRDDVARRLGAAVGVAVGEVVGDAGDPPGIRLERALRRWIPTEVRTLHGRATVAPGRAPELSVDGARARCRAVVLATGGLAGAGVQFGATLREATAGAPLWLGRERVLDAAGASRGADPTLWFGEDHARAFEVGVRTNAQGQVLSLDGATPLSPWLFAAGDLRSSREGGGVAGALATGALAGAEAARYARGG
jgi:anaerobic glycerol-3-phosphate dehydrogenase